ncbi:MAG: ribonuclease HII [bacterium]
MKSRANKRYVIGIDEVGRGPLAGPVAVGALVLKKPLPKEFRRRTFDSKQIRPVERALWYARICAAQKSGHLDFKITFVTEKIIDTKGLSFAIRSALEKSLRGVLRSSYLAPADCDIRLDGGLKAPADFTRQKTIIKGDASEISIGLASIVAKHLRDKKMIALHKKYPLYGFDVHKGYGTAKHRAAIRTHGLCPLHRRSFLTKIAPFATFHI